jgi:dTDP-glucose pyrophosphorylase
MKDWKKTLISREMTLREGLVAINDSMSQVAMVVDERRRLLGTLTDGDARRALLGGLTLSNCVYEVMHTNPICAHVTDSRQAVIGKMRENNLHQIPLLDENGVVMGLEILDDILNLPLRLEWVVIMAGGLGSRLKDLTSETPKPMLRVGSQPILETIVNNLTGQGFRRFYFSVNYKAEQIEDHFGNGSNFGIEIRYLRENKRLGTAGALSLLPESQNLPIIVTNADLLTKADIGKILAEHNRFGADATMAVREYEMQVPFGVVDQCDGRIKSIIEKPIQRFKVSAGIYVLSQKIISLVPHDTFIDMPTLFEMANRSGMLTRCHQVNEYWLDIGQLQDFERANKDFRDIFL